MTINYTIRFKIGTRDWIALYLLASKMFTGPTLNLCKVLRIFFFQFFGLNATPTLQPAEATTETKLGVNTTATTATIQTTSVGNLRYTNYTN